MIKGLTYLVAIVPVLVNRITKLLDPPRPSPTCISVLSKKTVTKVHYAMVAIAKDVKTMQVFNKQEKGSAVGNNAKQTPRGCQSKYSMVMIPIAIGVLTKTMASYC